MTIDFIGPEAETCLTWDGITAALEAGHGLPPAQIDDTFLYRDSDTLLSRAAWIDGMGIAVKSATIFPGNAARQVPTINGAVSLFSDGEGRLEAVIDFHLVTRWKTAGDSLLAARRLARPDSREILIVGAGTVARSMIEAYASTFPEARFSIWNRSPAAAHALAAAFPAAEAVADLEAAVRKADIIATATMARAPVLEGEWVRPGTHVDLIGAYRPDMREADDTLLRRASLYVDSRATTIGHIGEIADPIARGVISESDVRADFYDIPKGLFTRRSASEITVAKNGGGAHLDLMTSRYILSAWRAR